MWKPVSDFFRQNIYMHVDSKSIYSFNFLRLIVGAMVRTWKIKRIDFYELHIFGGSLLLNIDELFAFRYIL